MTKVYLVCIFILCIRAGEPVNPTDPNVTVTTINFAKLSGTPYELEKNNRSIFQFNAKQRRAKCEEILPQIDDYVTPSAGDYYVLAVHLYEFNDGTSALAWQCPTFPKVYVSHKNVTGRDHWYARVEKPHMQIPNFRIEMAIKFTEYKDVKNMMPYPHYFDKLDSIQRWNLCNEAMKIIQYDFEWSQIYFPSINNKLYLYYSFEYSNPDVDEIHRVLRCPSWPPFFLRLNELTSLREYDHDSPDIPVIVIMLLSGSEPKAMEAIEKRERNIEKSTIQQPL